MSTVRLTREQRGQVRRATNRLFSLERREFESSSSSAIYTTVVMADGKLMCDCRGWTIKKQGKPRQCKHTRAVINGRETWNDDEYVYLMGVGVQQQEPDQCCPYCNSVLKSGEITPWPPKVCPECSADLVVAYPFGRRRS